MTAYYNEWDAQAAAWLRELIKQGHIADGVVDERDIKEVEPADLREFTQCHFFAGIGGWSVALRLAGWADDRPVWTGSPPCQPFSVAGRGKGIEDDRHIAPVWLDLVKECRPAILFGEQVAAATTKDGWLDSLQDALEAEGYATGAAVLPACSVNAPHIRQRLWFTARLENPSSIGWCGRGERHYEAEGNRPKAQAEVAGSSAFGGLAYTYDGRPETIQRQGDTRAFDGSNNQRSWVGFEHGKSDCGLAYTNGDRRNEGLQQGSRKSPERIGSNNQFDGLGNANNKGSQKHGQSGELHLRKSYGENQGRQHINTSMDGGESQQPSQSKTQWGNPDWLWCRDGKWRPVESSTFPLADGIPARVGRLRGYGNAIVPQVAAEVIQVMMEYCDD